MGFRQRLVTIDPVKEAIRSLIRELIREKKHDLALLVLGTVLGMLASLVGALVAVWWTDRTEKNDERAAVATRMEGIIREAEYNFEHATMWMESTRTNLHNSTTDSTRIVLYECDLSMVRSAILDRKVVENVPPETVSLLMEYIFTGTLAIELHKQYNEMLIRPPDGDPEARLWNLKGLQDLTHYNSAVFAASCKVTSDSIEVFFDRNKWRSKRFVDSKTETKVKIDEAAAKLLSGRYERLPKAPRVSPAP